jgi:hypothetical protein
MNSYEELGLRPDATTEEIRQAYRSLARLLHPDQQADENLRRLAEVQMKRLNAIHDTLMDPLRRQQYDASLTQNRALVSLAPRPSIRRSWFGRDAGLLVAGMAAASLYWQLSGTPAQTPDIRRPVEPEQASFVSGKLAARRQRGAPPASKSRSQLPRRERGTGAGRGEAATPDFLPQPFSGLPARVPPVEPPSLSAAAMQAALPAPADGQPAAVHPRFAGTWVYVPPRVAPSQKALYRADYIEAVIVEDAGVLRGRYRARYEVPDRPISSEVAFRFEGSATNDLASLSWSGAGGAEGEVKLKLLSRNSMQLDWMATALGTQLGLASGTAVLVRREER